MSLAKDYLREDFEKKPEELQREADDVRTDMEQTLDQLMNQLSPGELINHALGTFKHSGDSAFTRNLINQVQNNPLPAVLAGCSLTWLMAASKQPPASPAGHGRVGEAKDKMSSATDTARSKAQGAREAGQQAASATSNLKEQMSETSQHAAENARVNARAAQQSYNDLLREQPLMMGALAVAVGAALGALIPPSRTEDDMIGEKSDETREELKDKAQQKMEETQAQASSSERERPESESQQHTQASSTEPLSGGQREEARAERDRNSTGG